MKSVIGLIAVAAIAVAAWFGGPALGLWGDSKMSEEDIVAGLERIVGEVNGDEDGTRYDDWSRLTSGSVEGTTATFEGTTILDASDLSEGYLDSRFGQAANLLCNDDETRSMIESGATFVYNWQSADGEVIGTAQSSGPEWCDESGY